MFRVPMRNGPSASGSSDSPRQATARSPSTNARRCRSVEAHARLARRIWDQELVGDPAPGAGIAIRAVAEVVRRSIWRRRPAGESSPSAVPSRLRGRDAELRSSAARIRRAKYKNLLVELGRTGTGEGLSRPGRSVARIARGLSSPRPRTAASRQTRVLKERKLGAAEELAALAQLIDQERRRQGISAPMDG